MDRSAETSSLLPTNDVGSYSSLESTDRSYIDRFIRDTSSSDLLKGIISEESTMSPEQRKALEGALPQVTDFAKQVLRDPRVNDRSALSLLCKASLRISPEIFSTSSKNGCPSPGEVCRKARDISPLSEEDENFILDTAENSWRGKSSNDEDTIISDHSLPTPYHSRFLLQSFRSRIEQSSDGSCLSTVSSYVCSPDAFSIALATLLIYIGIHCVQAPCIARACILCCSSSWLFSYSVLGCISCIMSQYR